MRRNKEQGPQREAFLLWPEELRSLFPGWRCQRIARGRGEGERAGDEGGGGAGGAKGLIARSRKVE